MDWKSVGKTVAKAAPLVGTLLGGPVGAGIGGIVASLFGVEGTPEAVDAALQKDPQALLQLRKWEMDHQQELVRMHLEAETKQLGEINQTMRAEAAAGDPYVRRWRPTFGYMIALTWGAQTLAVAWAMVAEPTQAAAVVSAVAALTPLWGIALAVLGVNVVKRSQDKVVAAGRSPVGLVQALAERLQP